MCVISRAVLKEEFSTQDDDDQISDAEIEDLEKDDEDFDDEKDIDDDDEYDDDSQDDSVDDQTSESHASSLNKNVRDHVLENVQSAVIVTEEMVENPEFLRLYNGIGTQFEAKNLEPSTLYQFRVCAVNNAGPSEWSNCVESRTPAAAPAPLSAVKLRTSSATSLTLQWCRPACHGEPITSYNFETANGNIVSSGDNDVTALVHNEFTLSDLRPDTTYNIRVQVSVFLYFFMWNNASFLELIKFAFSVGCEHDRCWLVQSCIPLLYPAPPSGAAQMRVPRS